jgi:hypothetical protein
MRFHLRPTEGIGALWMTLASCLLAVNPALQTAAVVPDSQSPPGENNQDGHADPLSGSMNRCPSPVRSIPC